MDNCIMFVVCPRAHATRFEEIGFVEQFEDPVGVVHLMDHEANYAHFEDLPEDPVAVYHGNHTSGDNYPACEFASDGKCYLEFPSDGFGHLVVSVGRNGKVRNYDLIKARRFLAFKRKVESMIDVLKV